MIFERMKDIPQIEKPDDPTRAEVSLPDASGNRKWTPDGFVWDDPEANLEQAINDYIDDLKEVSECPETIPDKPIDVANMEKPLPEEVAKKREEFGDIKYCLKREWEAINDKPWPKYDQDILSANGNLIRKAGSDYDAHHIQPLCMGGKNEASNITPLHAESHYDKQGIHSSDSPYSKIDKMLGGAE